MPGDGLNLSIGMNRREFFQNMKELKQLPKEQKQKIANFWKEDADGTITNEIELAILKGYTSKTGKVMMPKGDPNLLKEINRYGASVFSTERSRNVFWTRTYKDNSQEAVAYMPENTVGYDKLIDEDGDGIADRRIVGGDFYSKVDNGFSRSGYWEYEDTNLDGHLDKKINTFNQEEYVQENINEMMSEE